MRKNVFQIICAGVLARVALVAVMIVAVAACKPQVRQEMDTIRDLRPFIARSPAAAREKLDAADPVETLIAALADDRPQVVIGAVSALGKTSDVRAVSPLVNLLTVDDPCR